MFQVVFRFKANVFSYIRKKKEKEKATYVCSPPSLPFNVEKEKIHLDELIMSVTSFEVEGNFFC